MTKPKLKQTKAAPEAQAAPSTEPKVVILGDSVATIEKHKPFCFSCLSTVILGLSLAFAFSNYFDVRSKYDDLKVENDAHIQERDENGLEATRVIWRLKETTKIDDNLRTGLLSVIVDDGVKLSEYGALLARSAARKPVSSPELSACKDRLDSQTQEIATLQSSYDQVIEQARNNATH